MRAVLVLIAATAALSACASTAPAPPTRPPAIAKVTKSDLVRSKTVDGSLDYAHRREIRHPVAGTLTAAAVEGRTVRLGQRLYDVDARPVLLLYGRTPMFRKLSAGAQGPDVLQLQQNLRALGFATVTERGYGPHTVAAVKSLQKARGFIAPDGVIRQGDVVFQPGPVRVVAANARLADRVGGEEPVLTVASATPVIRVELDPADQKLARKGKKVEIALSSGTSMAGRVSTVIRPKGEDENLTVEIAFRGKASGTVSVTFAIQRRAGVLAVPVEAVVALREGGYGLQVVENGKVRVVAVEPGMTADGLIEVSGAGLREGMEVGVAKE
ncbi:peptidoglycan-binding protein [Streptosporangium sandarakinum]